MGNRRRTVAGRARVLAAPVVVRRRRRPFHISYGAGCRRRILTYPLSETMTTTTTTTTARVALATGCRVDVPAKWMGRALCIHAPIKDRAATTTRGVWVVSSVEYGYSAGTFRGPLRDAVRIARLWDAAFAVALATAPRVGAGVPSLRDWPLSPVWADQITGAAPATGPAPLKCNAATPQRRAPVVALDGDGGEQFPATATMTLSGPGRVRYARRLPDGRERLRHPETGKPVRMNGDCAAFKNPANPLEPVMRVWFGAAWFDVPSIAQCMEWSIDGVAETPDGSRVEPDATDSWLTLLGVI